MLYFKETDFVVFVKKGFIINLLKSKYFLLLLLFTLFIHELSVYYGVLLNMSDMLVQ